MTPKIYSDDSMKKYVCTRVLQFAENKCMHEGTREIYKFFVGEFKGVYGVDFVEEFCWLCSGVLQKHFLEACAKLAIDKVK